MNRHTLYWHKSWKYFWPVAIGDKNYSKKYIVQHYMVSWYKVYKSVNIEIIRNVCPFIICNTIWNTWTERLKYHPRSVYIITQFILISFIQGHNPRLQKKTIRILNNLTFIHLKTVSFYFAFTLLIDRTFFLAK